ncbi:MAG: hypothetical protein ABSC20_05900 [Candidatus Bathyarchaeia archaeon]|jgi:hypothetical protein
MKSLRVVRVNCNDGDTHFVFMEYQLSEKNQYTQDYDEIEVKKASKKEASKPLILNRSE